MIIIGKLGEYQLEEIIFGDTKYLHKMDEEYDYLIDNSDNKVKVNLRFTKNPEKNEMAKNGLKVFFLGISC